MPANEPVDKNRDSQPSFGANIPDDALSHFINNLIEQNAVLMSKLDQIESLRELAEKTLAEAKKGAEFIKAEAEKKASDRAAEIVAKAEQEAKAAVQEIISKAKEKAEADASSVVNEAKQRAEAVERKAQEILKAADEKASRIIIEAKRKAEEEARAIRQEAERILAESKKAAQTETGTKPKKAPEVVPKATEPQEPRAVVSFRSSAKGWSLLGWTGGKKEGSVPHEETVELIVLPPVAIDQLQKLRKYLKGISQVKILGLKGSLDSGIIMKVRMRPRIPLPNILADLPEVQKVSEKPPEAGGEGRSPKRIVLTMKK